MEKAEGAATKVGLDRGVVLIQFQIDLGNGVICWSPNDGRDSWEGKTVHNLVNGGFHGDKILVLTTDYTSRIARNH